MVKDSNFFGADVHSIHLSAGLVCSFHDNHHTDEYGGNLEKHLRAIKEILKGINQKCVSSYSASMWFGLKTFMKDFETATLMGEKEAKHTLEEGIQIAKLLESYGYDCLNMNTGTYNYF